MIRFELVKELPEMPGDDNSVSLIYEAVRDTLEQQRRQKESLESKANTLIAFAGGMFALLMGARQALLLMSQASQILIVLSVSLFAVSVILANIAVWIRTYRVDPNPEALAHDDYIRLPSEQTRLQIISNWRAVWKRNAASIERNANVLRGAFVVQATAFILLGMALALSVLSF